VLKLFFGGDPKKLAPAQAKAHQRKLDEYEKVAGEFPEMPVGSRLALEMGIAHERECIRFWSSWRPASTTDGARASKRT
jgi:hypothetical protein